MRLLKTNNPAKFPDFAPNGFKDESQRAKPRNRSFRSRNNSFAFAVSASWTPEANGPHAQPRATIRGACERRSLAIGLTSEKSCAKEVIRL